MIAYAVHESGRREVIGLDVGEAETESFWREFLRGLRRSGTGRSAPLRSQTPTRASRPPSPRCSGFPGSAARCTSCATCSATSQRPSKPLIATAIRQVFAAASGAEASERLAEVVERLGDPAPKVARLLEEARARRPGLLRLPPRALGRSCARPTRSSASTARSAGARTSSASSPTTRP
ncbi:MAG: transposase [Thermoleophilaceae bacterium]|nr:transposase [Thermoleophilaceae bacterium]